MKALVAATCVALLAAVGYYFWSEYSASQQKAAYAEKVAEEAYRKTDRGRCQTAHENGFEAAGLNCRQYGFE